MDNVSCDNCTREKCTDHGANFESLKCDEFTQKLKLCPFCNEEAELVEGQFGDWYVICPLKNNCSVHPMTKLIESYKNKDGQWVQGDKTVNTKKEAIRKWNKRNG